MTKDLKINVRCTRMVKEDISYHECMKTFNSLDYFLRHLQMEHDCEPDEILRVEKEIKSEYQNDEQLNSKQELRKKLR